MPFKSPKTELSRLPTIAMIGLMRPSNPSGDTRPRTKLKAV